MAAVTTRQKYVTITPHVGLHQFLGACNTEIEFLALLLGNRRYHGKHGAPVLQEDELFRDETISFRITWFARHDVVVGFFVGK